MIIHHPAARASEPVDPGNFTGDGTLVRMSGLSEDPRVNAYLVSLQAGARMAWHRHTGLQLLVVTEGTCRLQRAGEPLQDVEAGGVVAIEPGALHWHGASPEAAMTHLAINVDAATIWFEKVTDAEYQGSA